MNLTSPVPIRSQNYRVIWINQSEDHISIDLLGHDGSIYRGVDDNPNLTWLATSFGIGLVVYYNGQSFDYVASVNHKSD